MSTPTFFNIYIYLIFILNATIADKFLEKYVLVFIIIIIIIIIIMLNYILFYLHLWILIPPSPQHPIILNGIMNRNWPFTFLEFLFNILAEKMLRIYSISALLECRSFRFKEQNCCIIAFINLAWYSSMHNFN